MKASKKLHRKEKIFIRQIKKCRTFFFPNSKTKPFFVQSIEEKKSTEKKSTEKKGKMLFSKSRDVSSSTS